MQLLQSSSVRPDHTHLCLLLSSAALERALGDVSLLLSKEPRLNSEFIVHGLILHVFLSGVPVHFKRCVTCVLAFYTFTRL